MSLKRLSANNLDLLEDNLEDDNVSIVNGIEEQEDRQDKDKANVLNPSFFFRSYNSVTFNWYFIFGLSPYSQTVHAKYLITLAEITRLPSPTWMDTSIFCVLSHYFYW